MKIAFSGGEKGTYRSILAANGVQRIALNVTQLAIPKTKALDLRELLGNVEIYLYTSESDESTDRYDQFIREHEASITAVIGMPGYDGSWLGTKYVPLWSDPKDLELLSHLCSKYGHVAIADKALNRTTIPYIKRYQQRWGTKLYGLTSKTDNIEAIDWYVVLLSSWTSVVRYGETQVWDGHGLRRYPSQQKASARKKHRSDIVRMDVDFDAVMEDDVNELAKLAVRSWLEWEMHTFNTSRGAYDPPRDDDEEEYDTGEGGDIIATSPDLTNRTLAVSGDPSIAINVPTPRNAEDKILLPVMGVETINSTVPSGDEDPDNPDETSETTVTPTPTVGYRGGTVRNCDNCYLAARCPMFKGGSECAYQLPVELRTKEQLQAALRAMLEMQTSRVMFAAFAEELEGQGIDATLSNEMDRLFAMVERFKNISDTRDLIRFEMEAKTSSGVLSRIFGDRAAPPAHHLENPISMPELDSIVDAEVLDTES